MFVLTFLLPPAISPVYCLQFCYGMSSAFPAIVTPQLNQDCSDFTISPDQESWIVSVDNLMTPLVCLLSGLLQSQAGPRACLRLTCLPYLTAWILTALAGHYHHVWIIYIARSTLNTDILSSDFYIGV